MNRLICTGTSGNESSLLGVNQFPDWEQINCPGNEMPSYQSLHVSDQTLHGAPLKISNVSKQFCHMWCHKVFL